MAGQGREVVNRSPGFGDRGSVVALHARRPKGLARFCSQRLDLSYMTVILPDARCSIVFNYGSLCAL